MALSTGTVRFAGADGAPEHDAQAPLGRSHLLRAIDEVDYGMLIIDAQGTILHANHLARHELASGRMLISYGNSLLGSNVEFTAQMQVAMAFAHPTGCPPCLECGGQGPPLVPAPADHLR